VFHFTTMWKNDISVSDLTLATLSEASFAKSFCLTLRVMITFTVQTCARRS